MRNVVNSQSISPAAGKAPASQWEHWLLTSNYAFDNEADMNSRSKLYTTLIQLLSRQRTSPGPLLPRLYRLIWPSRKSAWKSGPFHRDLLCRCQGSRATAFQGCCRMYRQSSREFCAPVLHETRLEGIPCLSTSALGLVHQPHLGS